MRQEMQLLLSCVQPEGDPASIRTCAAAVQDWDLARELALKHCVRPAVYQRLSQVRPPEVPAKWLDELGGVFRANFTRNLYLTGELLKILNRFAAAGVPAIAYKGPVLASYYPNPAWREFGDLDLLVRREHIEGADRLLRADGFRPSLFKPCPQEERALPFARAFHFEMTYHKPGTAIVVDLHWALMPGFFALPDMVQTVWERTQTVMVAGRPLPTLSPEDTLLLLCVHGTKHIWERLGWMCDVARFIRCCPSLEWDKVLERAAQFRVQRALSLGLRLASDLAGAAVPEHVRGQLLNDATTDSLTISIRRQLLEDPDMHTGVLSSYRFYMRSRESVQDALRSCVERVFQPTMAEWESLPLPRPLFALYYVLRPVRLIGKHVLADQRTSA